MKLFTFFSLFTLLALNAQNNTIGLNEKLIYTASYNMSGIMTDLAQVNLETSLIKTSKSPILRLKCTALTYSKFDNFFKIRDLYESYVTPNSITPYIYNRDINEGAYSKHMKYTYNYDTYKINSILKRRDKPDQPQIFKFTKGAKDIVATLYSLRMVDFNALNVGAQKSFKVIFNKKEQTGTFTYLGKEKIKTALGEKQCYKLAISSSNRVLRGKNENLIWLTADNHKIIVYGKFSIPVGNGELRIKSAEGLTN